MVFATVFRAPVASFSDAREILLTCLRDCVSASTARFGSSPIIISARWRYMEAFARQVNHASRAARSAPVLRYSIDGSVSRRVSSPAGSKVTSD